MVRTSDIATGALVGYAASRTMDVATGWFHGRQSAASRRREDEVAPGGTLVQLGRQLGEAVGRAPDDAEAGRIGLAVHRTLGVLYGVAAMALARGRVAPLKAGVGVGTAAFLLVDEGTALSQARDFPLAAHLRGVVGHATYGLTAGLLLSAVRP